jgi:hypothetical protein
VYIAAWLFYSASAVLACVALFVTYQDSSYDNAVVGGDAYNFIIFAGRGAVWIGAAIVAAVIGAGCQVAGTVHRVTSSARLGATSAIEQFPSNREAPNAESGSEIPLNRSNIGIASEVFEGWLSLVRRLRPGLGNLTDAQLYHDYFLRGYDPETDSVV